MRMFSLCKGQDGATYHLFEGVVDQDGVCRKTSTHSICRKEDRENNICLDQCLVIKEMRLRVARLANAGEQICGICVSTMYRNQ